MTDTQNPRPVSLAELRAMATLHLTYGDTDTVHTRPVRWSEVAALLDIAEAAQAVAHEAEFYADDDTPGGSLIVVPRADMKKLDEALAKVRT